MGLLVEIIVHNLLYLFIKELGTRKEKCSSINRKYTMDILLKETYCDTLIGICWFKEG